jgi:hypothetical protein
VLLGVGHLDRSSGEQWGAVVRLWRGRLRVCRARDCGRCSGRAGVKGRGGTRLREWAGRQAARVVPPRRSP